MNRLSAHLPQQALPKSSLTNCTMYGSNRLTYHHGVRSGLVSVHVSGLKNELVLPSMAFCGNPPGSELICIGAFPAATFSTAIKIRRDLILKSIVWFLDLFLIHVALTTRIRHCVAYHQQNMYQSYLTRRVVFGFKPKKH